MSTNDWLAQLKEGDVVLVSGGFHGLREERVRKVTRTQIAAGFDIYRREDGRGRGSARGDLYEATPERLQEIADRIRTKFLVRELVNVRWSLYPLSVLEQVNAVLEAHASAEREG